MRAAFIVAALICMAVAPARAAAPSQEVNSCVVFGCEVV
jgi:hypothetical protein